ncbi:MAG: helix-turn-helix domain-containing protein [Halobacteriota archaeon]
MIEECLVVEIRIRGDGCPLADATAAAGADLEAAPPLLRPDGFALVRASTPVATEAALTAALDGDDRVRYLHRARGADAATYRFLSLAPCVVHDLTDAGLLVEALRYRDGEAHITGSVVGSTVLQGVLEAAGDRIGVSIERIHPLGPEVSGSPERRFDLTPAQEEALAVAHELGYFSVPRGATAGEVADRLGISKSAFLERLRRGQAGLVGQAVGEFERDGVAD